MGVSIWSQPIAIEVTSLSRHQPVAMFRIWLRCVCLCFVVMVVVWVPGLLCLRCYVCGGNSGSTCQGPIEDPVQECNDLINNRGCVEQYVNGVVLLRGCWLDGTNKCLRNGAAEVCTCNRDLCNSVSTSATPPT